MYAAGKSYRLTTDIVGIEPGESRVRGVLIPTGNAVQVVRCPSAAGERMADVLWGGKTVVVYERDLRSRTREIREKSAS